MPTQTVDIVPVLVIGMDEDNSNLRARRDSFARTRLGLGIIDG